MGSIRNGCKVTMCNPNTGNMHPLYIFSNEATLEESQVLYGLKRDGLYKYLEFHQFERLGWVESTQFLRSCEPEYGGNRWTTEEESLLMDTLRNDLPINLISCVMNRSVSAVIVRLGALLKDNRWIRSNAYYMRLIKSERSKRTRIIQAQKRRL